MSTIIVLHLALKQLKFVLLKTLICLLYCNLQRFFSCMVEPDEVQGLWIQLRWLHQYVRILLSDGQDLLSDGQDRCSLWLTIGICAVLFHVEAKVACTLLFLSKEKSTPLFLLQTRSKRNPNCELRGNRCIHPYKKKEDNCIV